MKALVAGIKRINHAIVVGLVFITYYIGFLVPALLRLLLHRETKSTASYWRTPNKPTDERSAY